MPQTPSAGGAPPAPTIPVFACGEPEEQPQGRGQCNFVGLYDWQAKLEACAAEVAWQGGRHSYNETAVERYVPRSHAETDSEGTYDYRDRSLWVRESIIVGGGTKLFAVVAHWRNPRAHNLIDDDPDKTVMMIELVQHLIDVTRKATRTRAPRAKKP